MLLLGLTFGSLTDPVTTMLAGNPRLAGAFASAGSASLADSSAAATALYYGLCVAAFAVGSVLRLRGEEGGRRGGQRGPGDGRPATGGRAWVVLCRVVLLGLFGPLLGLPGWATDLSPFGLSPAVPAEHVAAVPLAALTLLATALAALAVTGFRRRDDPV